MTEKEFDRFTEKETDWLRYYGLRESRLADSFDDEKFYDRLESIGYTKRVIPLTMRCPSAFITSDKPVLESEISDLKISTFPRNHEQNIYTPLEYMFAKKIGRYQEFINKLKEV